MFWKHTYLILLIYSTAQSGQWALPPLKIHCENTVVHNLGPIFYTYSLLSLYFGIFVLKTTTLSKTLHYKFIAIAIAIAPNALCNLYKDTTIPNLIS